MPKVNLKTEQVLGTDGQVSHWIKVCPCCHQKYETTSRRQKYCSSECAQKYSKRIKESRKRYNDIKPFERLRVRFHSIAVEVVRLEVEMGIRKNCCACCGSTEKLEVHHVDMNWMNSTPSNLKLLCHKCHSQEHSNIQKKLDSEGKLIEEFYEKSTLPFMRKVNKFHEKV